MSRNNCVGEAWLCGGPKTPDCYTGKKKSANLPVEPLFSCCKLAFPGNFSVINALVKERATSSACCTGCLLFTLSLLFHVPTQKGYKRDRRFSPCGCITEEASMNAQTRAALSTARPSRSGSSLLNCRHPSTLPLLNVPFLLGLRWGWGVKIRKLLKIRSLSTALMAHSPHFSPIF